MKRFAIRWPFSKKATTEDVFRELFAGREVKSGVVVTSQTALEVTSVFRCAQVLSDCVSTIPLRIFKKEGKNGERVPATDHPLYDIFEADPNPFQDALQFRETIAFHLVLTGNAYVFINRVGNKIFELIPIEPGRVTVEQNENFTMKYRVALSDGTLKDFPQEAIWHLRGPAWNGWMGLETVKLGREAIGLSMALEQSHARLHKNGVRSTGIYAVEGNLTDEQYKKLRSYLSAEIAGIDNSGAPVIIDRAAKFTPLAFNGVDAQHLETRNFQGSEICRLMGVMPIMVGFTDKVATYASAEQMFLAHAIHTARPLHRRFEASIKKNLLTKAERDAGYYPKFIDTELLRGAAKDRAEYYAKGISSGWLMRNEAREWEELNPKEGLSEPLSPMNMVVGNPAEAADPDAVAPKPDKKPEE